MGHEWGGLNRAERDHDDLGGKNKVCAYSPFDLVLLKLCNLFRRRIYEVLQCFTLFELIFFMEEFMDDLFKALVAKECSTEHKQWGHSPGGDEIDSERSGYEYGLVECGPLGHGPNNG